MTEQEQLEFRIEEYNEFYRSGEPRISDEGYDKLVEELAEKFPNSILLKKGVIEQPQKESRKRQLPIPMYSLNKCKTIEEIKQWLKSNNISEEEPLIITPKYDGISLVVNEANQECLTRGDGEEGQLSTNHFLNMSVKTLGEQVLTFGEAIMSKQNWEREFKGKINPYSGLPYTNARNTTAGFFNRDNPVTELQYIEYMRYGSNIDYLDKKEQLEALNELNSKVVEYQVSNFQDLNEENLNHLYQEWSKDYQIDGLVIDIDSAKLRKELGREENMNPKYARAYKNPSWSGAAEVKVTGITWQVSKQGKLKPVIQIEPTEVSGVTITNVTGYNAAYVFDNNISEGSIIQIVRSGDVIPKHIDTVSYIQNNVEDLMDELATCPCCGEDVKWDETMTELICVNPECKDKKIAKLVHFFSTLEVEDFGEPSIRTFYENGYDTIEKILNMKQFNIISIDGFGAKSSVRLLSQFNKLKAEGVPFAKLFHALDLFDGKIGEKTVQLMFDNVEWENLTKLDKLIEQEGIANTTAEIFIRGLKRFWHSKYELTLPVNVKYITTPKPKVIGDKLKGEKICFTGCRPSKEMEEKIQNQGGEIVSGVSKNTTMLVVKDMSEKTLSSTKARKAKELGIKIVEQRKFEI